MILKKGKIEIILTVSKIAVIRNMQIKNKEFFFSAFENRKKAFFIIDMEDIL